MILLQISGFLLIILGSLVLLWPEKSKELRSDQPPGNAAESGGDRARISGGAVIMIGPIPLAIGSDSRSALSMMLIALVIMIIWALVQQQGP
jgi:uncharacterized protein (TIGR00304 family)